MPEKKDLGCEIDGTHVFGADEIGEIHHAVSQSLAFLEKGRQALLSDSREVQRYYDNHPPHDLGLRSMEEILQKLEDSTMAIEDFLEDLILYDRRNYEIGLIDRFHVNRDEEIIRYIPDEDKLITEKDGETYTYQRYEKPEIIFIRKENLIDKAIAENRRLANMKPLS